MDGDNDVLSIGRYADVYGSFAVSTFRIGQFELSADQIRTAYNIVSQVATNGAFNVGALTGWTPAPSPTPTPGPGGGPWWMSVLGGAGASKTANSLAVGVGK